MGEQAKPSRPAMHVTTTNRLLLVAACVSLMVTICSGHLNQVCTSTTPRPGQCGKVTFFFGTWHSGVTRAPGRVYVVAPGGHTHSASFTGIVPWNRHNRRAGQHRATLAQTKAALIRSAPGVVFSNSLVQCWSTKGTGHLGHAHRNSKWAKPLAADDARNGAMCQASNVYGWAMVTISGATSGNYDMYTTGTDYNFSPIGGACNFGSPHRVSLYSLSIAMCNAHPCAGAIPLRSIPGINPATTHGPGCRPGSLAGAVCPAGCLPNHKISGNIKCAKNGQWDHRQFKCKALCGRPSRVPAHASGNLNACAKKPAGFRCPIRCGHGFRLVGAMTCKNNAKWSMPTCFNVEKAAKVKEKKAKHKAEIKKKHEKKTKANAKRREHHVKEVAHKREKKAKAAKKHAEAAKKKKEHATKARARAEHQSKVNKAKKEKAAKKKEHANKARARAEKKAKAKKAAAERAKKKAEKAMKKKKHREQMTKKEHAAKRKAKERKAKAEKKRKQQIEKRHKERRKKSHWSKAKRKAEKDKKKAAEKKAKERSAKGHFKKAGKKREKAQKKNNERKTKERKDKERRHKLKVKSEKEKKKNKGGKKKEEKECKVKNLK